ncbi:GNAT family N-acetyltransferase [Streptomyces sp. NPDC058872]|uniref:GNAT family N-acetyltransferase n=1 Tax=Streptomyces sp. NPDC058872 TaxID=3346661 RepID=UPI0036978DC2
MPAATPLSRTMDRSEAARLASLLATTFHQDALTRWMITDEQRRAELLPDFFRVLVELHAHHDGVLTSPQGDAVFLYLPPHAQPDDTAVSQALAATLGPHAPALKTITALQATHHPTTPPHYYLAFGAVRAGRQQTGLGKQLLTHILHRADHEGVGAYAEASSPGGQALLQTTGFTPLGADIVLPDNGPTLRPMWRDPR